MNYPPNIDKATWDLYFAKPLLFKRDGRWVAQFGRGKTISFIYDRFTPACKYLAKFVGRFD